MQAKTRKDLKAPNNGYYLSECTQTYYAKCLETKQAASIQKYITRLEDLKVIYVRRSNKPHINNLMGFYEFKELIDQYADNNSAFSRQKSSSSSNSKRSLMQKYNQVLRGKTYDKETLEQIRDYILEYNSDMDRLQHENPDDDYASKKKDVTVLLDIIKCM
jgi:hypothetical protein